MNVRTVRDPLVAVLLALVSSARAAEEPELHEVDPCRQTKALLRALDGDLAEVKGARLEATKSKATQFKAKWAMPNSSQCRVFTYDDGSAPFYSCALHTGSCKQAVKQFAAVAQQLTECLGSEPDYKGADKERKAKWLLPGKKQVRLTFKKGATCDITYFVEK